MVEHGLVGKLGICLGWPSELFRHVKFPLVSEEKWSARRVQGIAKSCLHVASVSTLTGVHYVRNSRDK